MNNVNPDLYRIDEAIIKVVQARLIGSIFGKKLKSLTLDAVHHRLAIMKKISFDSNFTNSPPHSLQYY